MLFLGSWLKKPSFFFHICVLIDLNDKMLLNGTAIRFLLPTSIQLEVIFIKKRKLVQKILNNYTNQKQTLSLVLIEHIKVT